MNDASRNRSKLLRNKSAAAPVIAIGIVIILILAACVVVSSGEELRIWDGIGGGGGGGSSKNFKVAIIYLDYGDNEKNPSGVLNQAKKVIETESTNCYSVKSFYAKYGVGLSFTYHSFKVPMLTYFDGSSNDQKVTMAKSIITTWAKTQSTNYYSIYDRCDALFFILRNPSGTMEGRAHVDGYAWLWETENKLFTDQARTAFSIAHELGHLFGGKDHRADVGSKIVDKGCLMNMGGLGDYRLWKGRPSDTVFGPTDLNSDLHLSYLTKIPRNYFANR